MCLDAAMISFFNGSLSMGAEWSFLGANQSWMVVVLSNNAWFSSMG